MTGVQADASNSKPSQTLCPIADDRRREARKLCRGEVRLCLEGDDTIIYGNLLDVSSCGFRAAHNHPEIRAGRVVNFDHKFFRGLARVMWLRVVDGSSESGFLVIRKEPLHSPRSPRSTAPEFP